MHSTILQDRYARDRDRLGDRKRGPGGFRDGMFCVSGYLCFFCGIFGLGYLTHQLQLDFVLFLTQITDATMADHPVDLTMNQMMAQVLMVLLEEVEVEVHPVVVEENVDAGRKGPLGSPYWCETWLLT